LIHKDSDIKTPQSIPILLLGVARICIQSRIFCRVHQKIWSYT